jgi:Family of unknown function (DUF6502)
MDLSIMSDNFNSKSDAAPIAIGGEETALSKAVYRLLAPLARLCLANGVTFASVEEALKLAFVQEANALQPGAPEHGMVSRVSTATGINRREVTRLTKLKTTERTNKQPLASEILARWTTDPLFRDENGVPCTLSRLGKAPSFEALAQTVTRDVHPRSMMDELIRLGIITFDEKLDQVSLIRTDFIPKSDALQMLGLLGDNVGDHFDAAVTNVLQDGSRHLEQAVFADELSAESIEALRPMINNEWKALREKMVPVLTSLIESDKIAGRPQDQRVRIGLYSFAETTSNNNSSNTSRVNRRFRKPVVKERSDES